MYILIEKGCFETNYYTGKICTHQGEEYPVVCSKGEIDKMKVYKSKKRAENSCIKLNKRCGRSFEVEEVTT